MYLGRLSRIYCSSCGGSHESPASCMYCNEVHLDYYWYVVQPNFDAQVEPLSFLQSNSVESEDAKYAPVVYGDHVIKKVLNNFG